MGSDVVYDHLSSRNTKFGVIRMWVYAIAKTMGMIEFTSKKKYKEARKGPTAVSTTNSGWGRGRPAIEGD